MYKIMQAAGSVLADEVGKVVGAGHVAGLPVDVFTDFKIRFKHGKHPFRGDYSTDAGFSATER